MPELVTIAKLLILLTAANGGPVVATRLFGKRCAWPLDGGLAFVDGRPLFGTSKTVRGLAVALVATMLVAVLIGESAATGLVIGATSMAGDLASSFVKRRIGLASSSQALGLDQIPEALLPALAAIPLMGLSLGGAAVAVAAFFVGELVLSRWLYRLGFRDRPY